MSAWFVRPPVRAGARLTLVCVPNAGRGASLFFPWRRALPEWIEPVAVQLPGREGRFREPLLRRIPTMAEGLLAQFPHLPSRPYALFGHSMGALVCYELALALRRAGAPPPIALVLSGRGAPTLPDGEPKLHVLPDNAFLAAIRHRYGGIPDTILNQPDMIAMLLPIMRADLEAVETYAAPGALPLPSPFLLYGGLDDPQAPRTSLAAWTALGAGTAQIRLFAGGHFYFEKDIGPLMAALQEDLGSLHESGAISI